MRIEATTEEKLKVVYTGLVDGLHYFGDYGLSIDYDQSEYAAARDALNEAKATGQLTDTICIEDIQTEMLRRGNSIVFLDTEDGDEEVGRLNLETIEANWDKIPVTRLAAVTAEDYDADDADIIMQVLAFGEVTYG